MDDLKTLVVFYSRTGTTKVAAERLAQLFGWDCDELIDRRNRAGAAGYARCLFDAVLQRTTELAPTRFDPSQYELVILATPIWSSAVSCAVRTYLSANASRMKSVAFLCTHGGSGAGAVLRQLERLAGKRPAATLVLRQHDVRNSALDWKFRAFVEVALRGVGLYVPTLSL